MASAKAAIQTSPLSIRDENGPGIQIDRAVLRQVQAQITGAATSAVEHDGTGGLLLGNYDPVLDALFVVRCKPCGQSADFFAAELLRRPPFPDSTDAERIRSRALSAVGFYRIFTDQGNFSEGDIRLMKQHFGERPNLFLLASRMRRSVSLFSWTDNVLRRRLGEITVDCPPAAPYANSEDDRQSNANVANPSPRGLTIRARLARAVELASDRRWVLGAGILLAGASISLLPRSHDAQAALRQPPLATVSSSPDAALELTAARVGNDWRVTWNRGTPILLRARLAVLLINDGESRRELLLDAGQISSGSVVYSPERDQVQFRLAVITADGANVSEVVTALGSRQRVDPPSSAVLSPQAVVDSGSELFRAMSVTPARKLRRGALNSDESSAARVSPALRPFTPPRFDGSLRPQMGAVRLPEPLTVVTSLQRATASMSLPSFGAEILAPPRPPDKAAASTQTDSLVRGPSVASPEAVTFTPPRVLHRTDFVIPASIRAFTRQGLRFAMTVELDANGRVVRTRSSSDTGATAHVSRIAAQLVRDWKFAPARMGDQNAPGEVVINFNIPPERP